MNARPKTWLALGVSLLLIVCSTVLYLRFDESRSNRRWSETEAVLRSEVLLLESVAMEDLQSTEPLEVQTRMQELGRAVGVRITLIRSDGTVLADSASNPAAMDNLGTRPEIVAALTREFGTCRRFSPTLKVNSLFVARAIRLDDRFLGWVRTSVNTDSITPTINAVEWGMLTSVALSGLGAALLGLVWLKRIVR